MFTNWKSRVFFALSILVTIANQQGFADFELSTDQQTLFMILVSGVGLILRFNTDQLLARLQKIRGK